jgi:phospholipid/cholesterol/gamma-HCH transport system substrate-binding protein
MWARFFLISALAIIALAVFAVVGRVTFLRSEFELTTLVDDSAGVRPSSPVLLNGIDVGHVVRVTLSGSPDPNKTVRILMRFPRGVLKDIPEDSTAAITAANLLGDKYVNISRGTHARRIQPGSEIPSLPTQDIGAVLSRANVPLNEINDVLARVDRILGYVNNREGTLGKLMSGSLFRKITNVSGQARGASDIASQSGILKRLKDISAQSRQTLARLDAIEAAVTDGKGSLGRFLKDPSTPSLTQEANETISEAKSVMAEFNRNGRNDKLMADFRRVSDRMDDLMSRIRSGQGAIGQFLVNPQLTDSLARVREELNSFEADFRKHPRQFVSLRFALF